MGALFTYSCFRMFQFSKYYPFPDSQPGPERYRHTQAKDPREVFSDPGATIVTRVKNYMQSVVKEVFADGRVNTEGYNFLERLFKH